MIDESLALIYERIAALGLPMFVGGSVASMIYGEPRSTIDIDVVVQARPEDAPRFVGAFPPPAFYIPPLAVVREELGRRRDGQFNVVDLTSGLKADIYGAGDDPLIAYGLAHAQVREVRGHLLRVAPATYVTAMKLRYFGMGRQDKHLRDIRSILALSPGEVDQDAVAGWADRFGVRDAWEACLRRPGEEQG